MNKNFYDLIFIISLVKNTEEIKNDIHEILKSYDVEILENRFKDKIGIRQLAYPIKKQVSGYYYILSVKMRSKDNVNFSKEIQLNEFILRYISFFRDVEKLERKLKKEEIQIQKKRKKEESLQASIQNDLDSNIEKNQFEHQFEDQKIL